MRTFTKHTVIGMNVVAWLTALTLTLSTLLPTLPTPAHAQGATIAPGFAIEPVVSGLVFPTAIAFANDGSGRIFIALKDGRVRVFQNGALLAQDFIDLSAQVNNFGDRGLIGLALHPNFPATPYVYVNFTYDPPGATLDGGGARVGRLLRITADSANTSRALAGSDVILVGTNSTLANIGDPNSEDGPPSCENSSGVHVRDCFPSDSSTHSVGGLAFGSDGRLYAAYGEGAAFKYADRRALRSQRLTSIAGKILRLDPITGQGLTDNPFFDGDPGSNQSKILDYGLRNPFRFTFHPSTNELYIGDVGGGAYEEINAGRAKNFGWPCFEGVNQQPGYAVVDTTAPACSALYAQGNATPPLHQYAHFGRGGAVALGAFYTGPAYPTQYQGALFFGDYANNEIKTLTLNGANPPTVNTFATQVAPTGLAADGTVPYGGPVQLIAGPNGDIYVVLINTRANNSSEIRRIRYAGGNTPPIAVAIPAPLAANGPLPLHIAFSGSASNDPDGGPISYAWNFGNGATSTQVNPVFTYTVGGEYTAVLTVTDSGGASVGSNRITVHAGGPAVTITTPLSGTRYNVGSNINFSGVAVDAIDGNLAGSRLQWEVRLHHSGHTHYNFLNFVGSSGTYAVPDHGGDTETELCLTATNLRNLATTRCVDLKPNLVTYTLNTQPTGLQVVFDGNAAVAPFTRIGIVNAQVDLAAPAAQGGRVFSNWSDGGARSRLLTLQSSDQTLTANYTTASTASCSGVGSITREVWRGIAGYLVSDLTGNAAFPSSPSSTGTLGTFEGPTNDGDTYGQRVRGYVCPPATGAYTFWISADDQAELYLSSNDSAANRQQIARVPGYNLTQRLWLQYPHQQSQPVNLVAGQRYYIEALHKESNGVDHFSVAWQGPTLAAQVIQGAHLLPFAAQSPTPTPTPTPTGGANLLTNGNFETGNASGWAVALGSPVVIGSAAQQGGFGMQMAGAGWVQQTFNTVAGQTYDVAAWVRVDSQGGGLQWGGAQIAVLNSQTYQQIQGSEFANSGNGALGVWRRVTFSFVAADSTTVLLYQNYVFPIGTAFQSSVDDIVVTARGGGPTPTPTPTSPPAPTPTSTPTGGGGTNLLSNGNFESGSLGNWYAAVGSPVVQTSAARAGSFGMQGNNPFWVQQSVNTTTGQRYYVAGWVRVDSSTAGVLFGGVQIAALNEQSYATIADSGFANNQNSTVGVWKQVGFSFVAQGSTTVLLLQNYVYPEALVFQASVDDVVVSTQPIPGAPNQNVTTSQNSGVAAAITGLLARQYGLASADGGKVYLPVIQR